MKTENTMHTEKYNGWTNYATWRVNLEMVDGLNPRDMGWRWSNTGELAELIEDFCLDYLMGETPNDQGQSLVHDYASAFLNDVNWVEIAKGLIENYKNET